MTNKNHTASAQLKNHWPKLRLALQKQASARVFFETVAVLFQTSLSLVQKVFFVKQHKNKRKKKKKEH